MRQRIWVEGSRVGFNHPEMRAAGLSANARGLRFLGYACFLFGTVLASMLQRSSRVFREDVGLLFGFLGVFFSTCVFLFERSLLFGA